MRARSTILGFAVLTLLLTAGTAQSLSGSNTVFTDDIVDGTITHADVKANSLGGSRFLDNSVTGGKILDGSVTGSDINEGTIPGFKKVYFARVMVVYPTGTEASYEVRLYGSEPKTGVSVAYVESPSEFKVTFPFDVRECAPSVTAGSVPGLVPPESTLNVTGPGLAFTTLKDSAPNQVSVKFKRDGGTLTADNFSLTLVCP